MPHAIHRLTLVATLTALYSLPAQAATYQFTGPLYSVVTDYTFPCSTGNCANYVAAAMGVSGHFTTAAPLAANLAGTSVLAQVSAYSFSDGLHTFTSADPGTRVSTFVVWTDVGGNITDSNIIVSRWQDNLAGPHGVGDRIDLLSARSTGAVIGFNNLRCDTIGVNGEGIADSCTGIAPDTATSDATYGAGGTWAAVPTIAVNDVSNSEGNAGTTNFTFTVTLSSAPTAPVSVDWSTVNGTATAGSDYVAGSGTLTWPIGDASSRTVTVQVLGDASVEGNENFTVSLNNPIGAVIVDSQGVGTINNDDAAPEVPPIMGNVPDQTGTVATAFNLALAPHVTLTNGDPVSSYAVIGALPPGLTLDVSTGIISGIPTSAGIYDVTVTATDNDGTSNADAVRFAINGPAAVPTLSESAMLILASLLGMLGMRQKKTVY